MTDALPRPPQRKWPQYPEKWDADPIKAKSHADLTALTTIKRIEAHIGTLPGTAAALNPPARVTTGAAIVWIRGQIFAYCVKRPVIAGSFRQEATSGKHAVSPIQAGADGGAIGTVRADFGADDSLFVDSREAGQETRIAGVCFS
jgi:hypothetical protein